MAEDKLIHHQSDLNLFEACGHCYLLERIEKKPRNFNFYLARGRGAHKSREVNFRQKITSGEDLDFDILADACRDEIVSAAEKSEILLAGDFEGKSRKGAVDFVLNHTLPLIRLDRQLLMPSIQPEFVEQFIEVNLPGWPFNLAGKIDVIPVGRVIVDTKTSKMKWTQEKADKEYQPSHYWLLGRAFLGAEPTKFRYDILTETGKKIYAYTINTMRTEKDIITLLRRYTAMDASIKAGVFNPCHRGHWRCSAKWCSQYQNCKYVGN